MIYFQWRRYIRYRAPEWGADTGVSLTADESRHDDSTPDTDKG